MTVNINENLFEMVTILDQKKERMKMILTLTQQQGDLFTLDTIEKLVSNLQLKQVCIDEINRLDVEFGKYYSEFKEYHDELMGKCKSSTVTETLTKRLKEGISWIQDLIREIQKVESENYKKAAGLVQLVQESLRETSNEKKAIASYGKNQLQKAALEK